MLKIYLITVVFAIICIIQFNAMIKKDKKKRYTNEQIKLLHKNMEKNPIATITIIAIPVFNVFVGLAYVFAYEKLRNAAFEKYDLFIKEHNNDTIDTTQK